MGARRACTRRAAAGLALLVAWLAPAHAGEWLIVPRVNVEETYTDNVTLSASGLERDDFITSIEPGIAVRGVGRGLTVDFEYNLEGLRYLNNRTADTINHQGQANATAEVWEDVAFLDVQASRSQQNTNSLGVTAADNLSVTGNSTDVVTYSASPYVRHHLGNVADTEARVTVDTVSNESNGVTSRSHARTARFQISSGSDFQRAPWQVVYEKKRIETAAGAINRFRKLEGELRYRITRQYGVLARIGHERNRFDTSQPRRDGRTWSVGATWTPTERTSVEAGFGRRFFDRHYFLEATHRTRRLRFSASFKEDVTTTRQLQLERVLVPVVDAAGEPVFDPVTGTQIEVPIDSVNPTDEVLVQSAFNGEITYTHRRTDATLSLYDNERAFQLSGNKITVSGARLRVNHRLSRAATLTFSGTVQVTEDVGSNQEDERVQASLRYSHQLGRGFRATAGLAHLTQDSTRASNEFDENRLTFGVLATF